MFKLGLMFLVFYYFMLAIFYTIIYKCLNQDHIGIPYVSNCWIIGFAKELHFRKLKAENDHFALKPYKSFTYLSRNPSSAKSASICLQVTTRSFSEIFIIRTV